jgi:hypothetical protein
MLMKCMYRYLIGQLLLIGRRKQSMAIAARPHDLCSLQPVTCMPAVAIGEALDKAVGWQGNLQIPVLPVSEPE